MERAPFRVPDGRCPLPELRMEEDWSIVKNDCLLYSVDPRLGADDSFLLHMQSARPILMHPSAVTTDGGHVKMEPEDTSDYHGSSSNSPSSLSDSLGVPDYSPLTLHTAHHFPIGPPHSLLHSPATPSSVGLSLGMGSLTSPLPPVSHFSSHFSTRAASLDHGYFVPAEDKSFSLPLSLPTLSVSKQSPIPKDDESGMCGEGLSEESRSPSPSNSAVDALYHHRMQVRTRSKMHEMALQHRLITDQDPRGCGSVHLSAEERRTLVQEGFPVPSKLPLSKAEEEALRIVRRKIKNKLSAQESRRKRKEYIDTLEQRCQMYATENSHLKARLKQLEAHIKKCNGGRL